MYIYMWLGCLNIWNDRMRGLPYCSLIKVQFTLGKPNHGRSLAGVGVLVHLFIYVIYIYILYIYMVYVNS